MILLLILAAYLIIRKYYSGLYIYAFWFCLAFTGLSILFIALGSFSAADDMASVSEASLILLVAELVAANFFPSK